MKSFKAIQMACYTRSTLFPSIVACKKLWYPFWGWTKVWSDLELKVQAQYFYKHQSEKTHVFYCLVYYDINWKCQSDIQSVSLINFFFF